MFERSSTESVNSCRYVLLSLVARLSMSLITCNISVSILMSMMLLLSEIISLSVKSICDIEELLLCSEMLFRFILVAFTVSLNVKLNISDVKFSVKF